jgi:hypothetical protein
MNDENTISICPRCQQYLVRALHSGDYVHTCFGSETLKNEDVPLIGPWIDYTGSDTTVRNALKLGQENTLFGTRAFLEGGRNFDRTSRGFPKVTHRTRQHLHTIDKSHFKGKRVIGQDDPEMYDESKLV